MGTLLRSPSALTTPVLIASIRATARIQTGHPADAASWLGLLAAFDAVFIGVTVFGQLLEERVNLTETSAIDPLTTGVVEPPNLASTD